VTIGYGSGGVPSFLYTMKGRPSDQVVDVGFIKIFLTTIPVNLSSTFGVCYKTSMPSAPLHCGHLGHHSHSSCPTEDKMILLGFLSYSHKLPTNFYAYVVCFEHSSLFCKYASPGFRFLISVHWLGMGLVMMADNFNPVGEEGTDAVFAAALSSSFSSAIGVLGSRARTLHVKCM
jgi:hypothetical protein